MDKKELLEKYHIIEDGQERIYCIKVYKRDIFNDGITPKSLLIDKSVLEDKTWSNLLTKLAKYLQITYPKDLNELYSYRTDWTKQTIYSKNKIQINSKEVMDNLFINVNHTSLHSIWLIIDLLNLYKIDLSTVSIFAHYPCKFEPEEVRNYFESINIENYIKFLLNKGVKEDNVDIQVKNIQFLNKYLDQMNFGYNNFFLFDNNTILSSYKNKFLLNIKNYVYLTEKQYSVIKKSLDYLTEFYEHIKRSKI